MARVFIMRRRALLILLLIFQAFWLNVVVPGHTRGSIGLTACACRSVKAASACCGEHQAEQSNHPPARDPSSNCAICYFAAHLTLPPVIDLRPPALGLVEVLDPPCCTFAISYTTPLALRDRGPPHG